MRPRDRDGSFAGLSSTSVFGPRVAVGSASSGIVRGAADSRVRHCVEPPTAGGCVRPTWVVGRATATCDAGSVSRSCIAAIAIGMDIGTDGGAALGIGGRSTGGGAGTPDARVYGSRDMSSVAVWTTQVPHSLQKRACAATVARHREHEVTGRRA